MSTATADNALLTHHYRCRKCRREYTHTTTRARFFDSTPLCPGPGCRSADAMRVVPLGIDPRDVALRAAVSKYQGRTQVESNTLPLHTPGADSYSPEGKPRFESLRKLKYVGEKFGLHWV